MAIKEIQIGMSMRFKVVIHGEYDLGSWSKVSGLDVEWTLAEYRAGDQGNDRWYFPGPTKYTNVTLERACEADGTEKVRRWLSSNSFKMTPQTGAVTLLDAMNEEVTTWDLEHIVPVKWSITPFESTASTVAKETLTIAHMGFLADDKVA